MIRAYFDSSVLVAILLGESTSSEAASLWEQNTNRVSSLLLEAECFITLQRQAPRAGKILAPAWAKERIEFLAEFLDEITLQKVDDEIVRVLRREPLLAECRTLDAIHLATALFFHERAAREDFVIVSFDKRLRETAAKLNMKVLPY